MFSHLNSFAFWLASQYSKGNLKLIIIHILKYAKDNTPQSTVNSLCYLYQPNQLYKLKNGWKEGRKEGARENENRIHNYSHITFCNV